MFLKSTPWQHSSSLSSPPISDPWQPLSSASSTPKLDPWSASSQQQAGAAAIVTAAPPLATSPTNNNNLNNTVASNRHDPWSPTSQDSSTDLDEFDVISNRNKTLSPIKTNGTTNGTSVSDPFELNLLDENLPVTGGGPQPSTGATKKTPQSFLGENSALVNLDNLVTASKFLTRILVYSRNIYYFYILLLFYLKISSFGTKQKTFQLSVCMKNETVFFVKANQRTTPLPLIHFPIRQAPHGQYSMHRHRNRR